MANIDALDRFQASVARTPGRTAVWAPDGEISFAELDLRVRQLAGALRARGVGRGTLAGICLPRRLDLVPALLAVWWAGGGYVPLDPAHPMARLSYMARDARVRLVLTAWPDSRWPSEVNQVALSELETGRAPAGPPCPLSPADPAYVIYTSGSTGRPKGVLVSRGNVAHLLGALEDAGCYASEPRRVAWNASISFDASVQQWARVCRADTVVLIDEDLRTEPRRLAAFLREHQITDFDATPSHWDVLHEHVTPGGPLRLFLGGEAMPDRMWSDLAASASRGDTEAVNLYGPTEATVDATAAWVGGQGPHIGRPLRDVRALVLDSLLRPVQTGELYLAGAGIALGYVHNAALTAQRFVPDVASADGSRMYRTGDRVSWREDGSLTYLDRVDRQVKLHGYRIELGEIEAVLAAHPHVGSVTVVLTVDQALGQILAAYYVPAGNAELTGPVLREYALTQLPQYMIPAAFTALESLPLTVNGKVDRAALPAVAAAAVSPATADAAPADPIEELIAETWAQVLGRERVLATDDFFVLGGHSLVALRLVAQLKRQLGLVIPTKVVYQHPRLRDLAAYIRDLMSEAVPSAPAQLSVGRSSR